MNQLIEDILALEWNEFQKVNNEGGRASCQDNWREFQIHRRSQFLAWNQVILESYYQDLIEAIKNERNLITEKYARMMESTVPERYKEIEGMLPHINDESKKSIEDLSKILTKWAEKFAEEYPSLSEKGRPIHSYEDGPYMTSLETYTRGELSTYSEKTLKLYYEYVQQLLEENNNLTKMVMENTVREYGFDSLNK